MFENTSALPHLSQAVNASHEAMRAARAATQHLEAVRATRAHELVEKLADVVAFAQRLAFACEADVRYEQACHAADNGIRLIELDSGDRDMIQGQWGGYDR